MKLIRVLSALGVFICFVLWVSSALAARNASGTYSKLYTFVAGQVLNSSNMNSQFSDIETEITDSLDRSGKGGMLAALRGTDGTVTAPAFSFTSETGTGLYRIGSSNPGLTVNQSKKQEWTSTGTAVTGTLSATSDFSINTNKFAVTASSGNTAVAGTLGVTSDVAVNTNKFTVTASSGNTAVAGTLGVTGATTATGGVTIGSSGTAITKSVSGTGSFATGNMNANTCVALTVTTTGSASGAPCAVGNSADPGDGRFVISCRTHTADQCSVDVCNVGAITIDPGDFTVRCTVFNP